jgi:hypothetical protein
MRELRVKSKYPMFVCIGKSRWLVNYPEEGVRASEISVPEVGIRICFPFLFPGINYYSYVQYKRYEK